MKAEIYIVNLVKISKHVRTIIADLIKYRNFPDSVNLLLTLILPETFEMLTTRLNCQQDQTFVRLAEYVKQDIENRSPRPFTIKHLYQLGSANTHRRLAQVLNCEPSEVLDELFDAQPILNLLFEVEPGEVLAQLVSRIEEVLDELFDAQPTLKLLFEVEPGEVLAQLASSIENDSIFPSASTAFYKLLVLCKEVAEYYEIGEFEWGRFIDERQWLRTRALTRLRSHVVAQGTTQKTIGANLLTAIIDPHDYDIDNIGKVHLDALAIIHIQQRISWIVRQLREQAQELADKITDIVPISSSLAELQPYIEFYELNAPANAWRIALNLVKSRIPPIQKKVGIPRNALINACTELQPELIQSLILAGVHLPSRLNSAWSERLNHQLPITPCEYNQDIVYPKSRTEIMEQIRRDYANRDNVQIIE